MNRVRIGFGLMTAICLIAGQTLIARADIITGTRVPGVLILTLNEGVLPQQPKSGGGGKVMGIASLDQLNSNYDLRAYRGLFRSVGTTKGPARTSVLARIHILRFDEGVDLDRAAADYRKDPTVSAVDFDTYALMESIPNDPRFPDMWNLMQVSNHDIDADEAWDETVGHPSVILGITDTGVLYEHEDLGENIWVNPGEDLDADAVVYDGDDMNGVDDDGNGYVDDLIGWDFVENGFDPWPGEDGSVPDNDPKDFNGHGTHTSGTAAAVTNNALGVSGIAGGFGAGQPGAGIMCLRMGWSFNNFGSEGGVTQMSYVAEAFVYAADMGARVINYSFGSSGGGGIEAATDYAVGQGVMICAAAGNSGSSSGFGYLQSRPDVITVASTNQSDARSFFSNFGGPVDISAPGSDIWSTVSNHYVPGYASFNGTSMAAPHVVGVLGLLLSLDPTLTRTRVIDIFAITSDPTADFVGQMGAGRINAKRALGEVRGIHILHSALPNTHDTVGDYPVVAVIASDTVLNADSLLLSYRTTAEPGGIYHVLPLLPTGNPNEFGAAIPVQPLYALIQYGLTAENARGDRASSPTDFPANAHQFSIVTAPAILVEPPGLSFSLATGDTDHDSIRVINQGLEDLRFRISQRPGPQTNLEALLGLPPEDIGPLSPANQTSEPTRPIYPASSFAALDGSVNILAWTAFADVFQEYPNMLNALSSHFTDFTLTETNTTDPVQLAAALAGKDVFLIPEQEFAGNLTALGGQMAGALSDFLNGGGAVIACDYWGTVLDFLNASGVMDVGFTGTILGTDIHSVLAHPVTTGLDDVYQAQDGTLTTSSADGTPVIATVGGNQPVAFVRTVGAGKVVFFGWDYFSYSDFMSVAIANAVQWASGGDWLSFAPLADTVPPGGEATVMIDVDAEGLNSGDYSQLLVIGSNDPERPTVEVPVALRVRGPEIDVNLTPRQVSLEEGFQKIVRLGILNIGEETLHVAEVRSDQPWLIPGFVMSRGPIADWSSSLEDDGPLPVPVDTSQDIPPGHAAVAILWASARDLIPGEYLGVITVISDDTDEGALDVSVILDVGPDPDIDVVPESISVVLVAGDSTEVSLSVENNGLGTLSFAAEVRFLAAPAGLNSERIPAISNPTPLTPPSSYSLTEATGGGAAGTNSAMAIPFPGNASGIAFSSSGQLHAASLYNNEVLRLAPGGAWELHTAGVIGPYGVAFSAGGQLAVAEIGDQDVVLVNPDGTVDPLANDIGYYPLDLAYDPTGNLLVTTDGGYGVLKIEPNGSVSDFAAGLPSTTFGAAFGPDGRLYVSTFGDGTILAITPDGAVSTYVTIESFLEGLVFDVDGNLYCANGYLGYIYRIAPDLSVDVIGSGYPGPLHLALDDEGLLYISSLAVPQIDTLRVGVPGVSLPGGGRWLTVAPEAGLVAPGGSMPLMAMLRSSGLKRSDSYASLRFSSNDPDENPLDVPVHLHIQSPEIVVRPSSQPMNADEGQTSDSTIWVVNTGDGTLNGSTSGDVAWLSGLPTPFAVAPADSLPLTVRADASALIPGDYLGVLTLSTNDFDEEEVAVPVALHVGPDPDIDVVPESLSYVLNAGDSVEASLDVHNLGLGTLSFEARVEFSAGATGGQAEPVPYPPSYYETLERGQDDPRAGAPVIQGFGGPDSAGYRWIDSDEPGGPVFTWTDISATGTPVGPLNPDSYNGPFAIGFDFPYYEGEFSQFWISTKGFIGFGPDVCYGCWTNTPLPSGGDPNNMIAWYWDDLRPSSGSNPTQVFYQSAPESLVVQFTRYRHWCCDGGPWITGQIIIFSRGTILLKTLEVQPGFEVNGMTVGIENQTGTDGLEVAFNTPYVHDDQVIRIRRVPDWLSIDTQSGLVPPGGVSPMAAFLRSAELDAPDWYANIVYETNDPNENPFVVPVHLHLHSPEIAIHPPALMMESDEGSFSDSTVWIVNTGDADLDVSSVVADVPWLSGLPTTMTVLPLDSLPFTVRSDAVALIPGDYAGTLTLTTNDYDEAGASLPVALHVGPDPDIEVLPESISVVLTAGDSTEVSLSVENNGLGTLSFAAEVRFLAAPAGSNSERIPAIPSPMPLTPRSSYSLTEATGGGAAGTNSAMAIPFPGNASGIAFSSSGQLHAASLYNNEVLRLTPGDVWELHTAAVNGPYGVAFSVGGQLTVAEPIDQDVVLVNPDGTVDPLANDIGYYPLGLAYDPTGNLLVTTDGGNRVLKIEPNGSVSDFAAGLPSTTFGAAFGPDGRLYVSTFEDGSILAITPAGDVSTYVTIEAYLEDLVFDVEGNLYCANGYLGYIYRIAPDLSVDVIGSGYPGPLHLALDDEGLLYISSLAVSQIDTLRVGVPGVSLPGGGRWLTVAPEAGLVAPGGSVSLTAMLRSAGVNQSDSYASLRFSSNDPDESPLEIPVHLHVPSASAGCVCPCHGDPSCDGTRVDIIDVALTVHRAFRGDPALDDPGCTVPGTSVDGRSDIDCNGSTDIVDVVRLVNVAFRGGDPATVFCNPCH